MYYLLTRSADDPAWEALKQDFPPPDASAQQYIAWLERATQTLDEDLRLTQAQAAVLEGQIEKVKDGYADSADKSLGLSANLLVDKITDDDPEITSVRQTAQFIVIGSALGLIAWTVLWLTRISIRINR
jgi:hypothetical protein